MDKKIVPAYFLSVLPQTFKDKANGEQVSMYKLNFLGVEENKPMSFWANSTDFAAKYAHLKPVDFSSTKGIQGGVVKLVLQLRETTNNTYKLSLLGLEA